MTEVRAIRASDEAAWRRLFTEYGLFYETELTDEILDHVWRLLLDDSAELRGLVAVLGAAPIGFAHYRRQLDTFSTSADWYLDDLYVSPEVRGTGAGTALIDAIETIAREDGPGGKLRWITAADNETAQRVYDRVARRTTWITYEKRIG